MESTGRKAEIIKPIILKVGIPVVLSVAGFVCAMITAREKVSSQETQVNLAGTNSGEELEDQESFESTSVHFNAEEGEEEEEEHTGITDTQIMNLLESTRIQDRPDLEEENLGLRSQVGVLQERERELERQFLHYCDVKEQELALMELRNMLLLEVAHVEFLGHEVNSMEAESRRLEAVVVEYLRIVEQLNCEKHESGLLQRRVKNLMKMMRKRARVLRRQGLIIRAREAEILISHEELAGRDHVVKEFENEVVELRTIVDRLQEERKEFMQKLELAEISALSTLQVIRAREAEILTSHEELERRDHVIKEFENEVIKLRTIVDQLQEERRDFVQKLEFAESSVLSTSQVIRAREAEILKSHEELERRDHVIKEFENEVLELRTIVDQLQEERREFVQKLEFAESSALSTSQTKAEAAAMEENIHLFTKLEQLRKDREAEMEELIHLRWINACLRHELTRNQEKKENQEDMPAALEGDEERRDGGHEYDSDGLLAASRNAEACSSIKTTGHASSKRRRLLHKLRKWMEGSEKSRRSWGEKEKHQNICMATKSVSTGAVEHLLARKSCSSA